MLNITVPNVLTVYEVRKRRGSHKPKQEMTAQGNQDDDYQDDFNDGIPF